MAVCCNCFAVVTATPPALCPLFHHWLWFLLLLLFDLKISFVYCSLQFLLDSSLGSFHVACSVWFYTEKKTRQAQTFSDIYMKFFCNKVLLNLLNSFLCNKLYLKIHILKAKQSQIYDFFLCRCGCVSFYIVPFGPMLNCDCKSHSCCFCWVVCIFKIIAKHISMFEYLHTMHCNAYTYRRKWTGRKGKAPKCMLCKKTCFQRKPVYRSA